VVTSVAPSGIDILLFRKIRYVSEVCIIYKNCPIIVVYRWLEVKVLVAYMSETGNTKKVAEAIYDEIPQPKEIKRIEDVTSLEGYDLTFLGFPMHHFGSDGKVKTFLETYAKDKKIALFITHMAPEGFQPVLLGVQKFRDAAVGANIVGVFDCQGQACQEVKTNMLNSPSPQLRRFAQADNSQGQPDSTRLERARTFATETMDRLKP
jgi:flavodoxin